MRIAHENHQHGGFVAVENLRRREADIDLLLHSCGLRIETGQHAVKRYGDELRGRPDLVHGITQGFFLRFGNARETDLPLGREEFHGACGLIDERPRLDLGDTEFRLGQHAFDLDGAADMHGTVVFPLIDLRLIDGESLAFQNELARPTGIGERGWRLLSKTD